DHGLFICFGPVANPKYAAVCIVEHGAVGHPQVLAARDVLNFAMKRDPSSLPAAYPMTSADTAQPKQQSAIEPILPKAGGCWLFVPMLPPSVPFPSPTSCWR